MRPPSLQQSTPREPHEPGPDTRIANNVNRCIVTDDGLLSPILSSELRTQNRNVVSFIKEFGCSHHKHVLYAHKCVVCSSLLDGALVTAFLLTLHNTRPPFQILRRTTYYKSQNLISFKSRTLLYKNHTKRLKNVLFKV